MKKTLDRILQGFNVLCTDPVVLCQSAGPQSHSLNIWFLLLVWHLLCRTSASNVGGSANLHYVTGKTCTQNGVAMFFLVPFGLVSGPSWWLSVVMVVISVACSTHLASNEGYIGTWRGLEAFWTHLWEWSWNVLDLVLASVVIRYGCKKTTLLEFVGLAKFGEPGLRFAVLMMLSKWTLPNSTLLLG